jgi:hypothetical protein
LSPAHASLPAPVALRLARSVRVERVALALRLLPTSERARRRSRTTTAVVVEITGE